VSGRYFVTGAQGFVGRYAVAHLLDEDRDAEVFGIGRSPADESYFTHRVHWGAREIRAALPPSLRRKPDQRYRYEIADLADPSKLRKLLKSFQPDFIVHLASGLRDDPVDHLFRTNVEGTVHLIEAIVAAGTSVQRIVFGSSGGIYGRSALAGNPLDEDAPCLPIDLYSTSKLASEHVARILSEKHGLTSVWARMFNIVGPGQEERHFCGKVAAQAAAIADGLMPATLEVGDLSPTRDFLDVRDVAAALSLLARRGEPGLAYNVASGREIAMSQVLDMALDIAGLSTKIAIVNTYRRASDLPRAYAATARLAALGFVQHFELGQSLSDLFDYYRTTVRSTANGA
jgi:nucleoside-diphosphate-sugar epimerase